MNLTISHGRLTHASIKSTMQSMELTVIKNSTSHKLDLKMKMMMSKQLQKVKEQLHSLKRLRRRSQVDQRHLVQDQISKKLWLRHNNGNRNMQHPMIFQIASYLSNSIGEMLMGMISQVR